MYAWLMLLLLLDDGRLGVGRGCGSVYFRFIKCRFDHWHVPRCVADAAAHVCPTAQAHELYPSVSLRQMVCVMMMGGSTDFLTPIGYQTNLMVRPYGNYAFLDYTKFGFLLAVGAELIACGMTLALID